MRTWNRFSCALAIGVGAALGCAVDREEPVDTLGADTARPGAAMDGMAPAAARTVSVTLREWAVESSPATISPGSVTFQVRNSGRYGHALEVEGGGSEWETAVIPVGGQAQLTATLSAGTYELYCPVVDAQGNHQQRGMRTTLVVR